MEARIQVGLERAQSRALFAFDRAASPNQAKTGTDSYAIYQAPEADPSEANGATFRTVPSGGNRLPRVPLSANEKGERERDIVGRAKEQLTQGLSRLAPARVLATGRVSGNLISPARLATRRMPTRVETLDNGLKVILRPIPDTKALSTWVVYRIGSRNEVPGMTGSTHWVEHMLFKGGGKLAKGDIDKMIPRLGGKMNAFTDTDYTMYFETIPSSAMDTALMIESERMRNAAFDPKEVEAERTVVISEREGAENQPEFAVEEELWGLAFHVHPYHWTAIGYKQDLATLDRDPLYRHYLRYYAPNNASLVLVGGFDPAVAMQHVREAFGALKPETPPDPLRLSEPEQHGERRSDLDRPGPPPPLPGGGHTPAASHEDPAALVLLPTVRGGWRGIVPSAAGDWQPRSNRLYRALVDARLATDVGVRQEMKLDPALLIASVTLARGASLDRVEAVLDREGEKLRKAPPPKAELARARAQVRARARDQPDGVTFQGILLSAGAGLGSWDFGEALLAKIEKVRAEQIRSVARTYLVDDHRTVVRFHAQEVSA